MRGARRCKQKWPFWMKNQHFGIPLLKWTKKWAFCVDPRMTKWGPRFSGWYLCCVHFRANSPWVLAIWGGHKDVHLSVPTKHFRMHICKCLLAGACTRNDRATQRITESIRELHIASQSFTKSTRQHQRASKSIPELHRRHHIQQYSTVFNNIQQYSTVFNSIQQYSTVFNSIQQYSTAFLGIQE